MSGSFIDTLFEAPTFEIGDKVTSKGATSALLRPHGTVLQVIGWYAVVKWAAVAKPIREYTPGLELEND